MADLPLMLRVRGRRCVVIGGGEVAQRRVTALLEAGADVTVVAPQVRAELAAMDVHVETRPYRAGDCRGAVLVIVATDDPAVNRTAAEDARAHGVLINRADDPDAGDVTIPAHAHHGPITLAVHTGGSSAAAAAAIRRELSAALDAHWPVLLETVGSYRRVIQDRQRDPQRRRALLRELTGPQAMATLKQDGPEALRRFCDRLVADLAGCD